MSYLAMSQHGAASLHPQHLKAMIAIGTDVDLYEEVAYSGGIFNEQFWSIWKAAGLMPAAIIGEPNVADFITTMKNSPLPGFRSGGRVRPAGERVHEPRPERSDSSAVGCGGDHTRRSLSPAWRQRCVPGHADLRTRSSTSGRTRSEGPSGPPQTVASHMAFFDHWLKGVENGIMDVPPVRLEIRTGNGASFVLQENEWPVARTKYTRWYLDATAADWAGTAARSDFLRLSTSNPSAERERSYSAEVRLLPPGVGAAIRLDPPVARV